MNYELFSLIEMVDSCMRLNSKNKDINSEKDFSEECKRVLFSLQSTITAKTQAKATAYLAHHQNGIINLLKKTVYFQVDKNIGKEAFDRLKNYQKSLTVLFEEIRISFPRYFDYNMEVPEFWISEFNLIHEPKLDLLIKFLQEKEAKIEIVILFKGIFLIHTPNTAAISLYKLEYLHNTLAHVERFYQETEDLEPFELITELISLELNHPLFYSFCCGFIISQIELVGNISEQYHSLQFLLKKIEQVQPIVSLVYEKKLPKIKHALIRFIQSEISFMRSLDFLSEELSSGGLVEKNYKVSFTVRQLAIFIHLQVESGIIIADKPRLIHQYVAKHFTTPETDKISEKSFKNNYYGNSAEDLEKIISKIAQMLVLAQERL